MGQLTLGILAFNDGEYLQELLNSIENQNNKDFNLLIINNASTDLSKSIINDFSRLKHEYDVQVINNSKNTGSFLGTKQLILNSPTSHLGIIHGDDVLKPNYVEVAKSYISLNPEFSAFNFDLEEIKGNENVLTGSIIRSNWTYFKMLNRILVAGLNPGVMPGAIINIPMLENIYLNREFEDYRLNGAEDIFLWQQIIRSSKKIMRVPVSTYLYRRHGDQVSKNLNIYGSSLGYARRVNFNTSKTRFEKLLCVCEIEYEFSTVNFDNSYLEGLNNLDKYRRLSIFRFINIFFRRVASAINYFTYLMNNDKN
jgi:glycosyltransferase involved in cell wall biosynthesis